MYGLKLQPHLELNSCPHCGVSSPNLDMIWNFKGRGANEVVDREWVIYKCKTCGFLISAYASKMGENIQDYFPKSKSVPTELPEKARTYLQQAIDTVNSPSASILVANSAVDAMLKEKEYTEGSLYSRIEAAATNNLITKEMAEWAHNVRLDANDERHADKEVGLPSKENAERIIDFVEAFGEFLFVLPSRVNRGLEDSEIDPQAATNT